MGIDLIRASLTQPIDWTVLERMACDILSQDDMPNLTKFGGYKDAGLDAAEFAIYQDSIKINNFVQIASRKDQINKYKETIATLQRAGYDVKRLTMVFKNEVSTGVRNTIQEDAIEFGILVDIRDESYLIRQLGKRENDIFRRYFKDLPEQIKALLVEDDPLKVANDRMKRSMLASLGAFVFNPDATNLKQSLFDQIVLCSVVSCKVDECKLDRICALINKHFGSASAITESTVKQSLDKLIAVGILKKKPNKVYAASESTLDTLTTTMLNIKNTFASLISTVLDSVSELHKLDDAQKGYLERNVKNTIAKTLRLIGPSTNVAIDCVEALDNSEYSLRNTMARDVTSDIAQTALACLSGYIQNPENSEYLSLLARSYRGLYILNEDPLGRSWQVENVTRRCLMLDTDALLFLLIEELPEHEVVTTCLKLLIENDFRVCIPEHVAHETADHISRAKRTFVKFAEDIKTIPLDLINKKIWHAVVRGYCYWFSKHPTSSFADYWRKYYDEENPYQYVLHQIHSIIGNVEILDFMELDGSDHVDLEQMVVKVLKNKESKRLKAAFRKDPLKNERVAKDVRFALYAAHKINKESQYQICGYIVSSDLAFQYIQKLPNWNGRPDVHILTISLSSLAEIFKKTKLDDDLVTQFIFSPISTAAALALSTEISVLNKVGVRLQEAHMQRLDWDLKRTLAGSLARYRDNQENKNQSVEYAIALANAAKQAGYELEPEISHMTDKYDDLKKSSTAASEKLSGASKMIDILRQEMSKTQKGKRRFNRIAREYGKFGEE